MSFLQTYVVQTYVLCLPDDSCSTEHLALFPAWPIACCCCCCCCCCCITSDCCCCCFFLRLSKLSQQFNSDLLLLLFFPKPDLAWRSEAESKRPSPELESLLPVRLCTAGAERPVVSGPRFFFDELSFWWQLAIVVADEALVVSAISSVVSQAKLLCFCFCFCSCCCSVSRIHSSMKKSETLMFLFLFLLLCK